MKVHRHTCTAVVFLAVMTLCMEFIILNSTVSFECPNTASNELPGHKVKRSSLTNTTLNSTEETVLSYKENSSIQDIKMNLTEKDVGDIDAKLEELKQIVVQAMKKLYKAKQHVRGSKTSDNLGEAIETIEKGLQTLGVNITKLKDRPTVEPKNVCPEVYKGTTFGYPFFYEGFISTNCTYGVPISKLVTIINYFGSGQINRVEPFLNSVYADNENYSVVLAVNIKQQDRLQLKQKFPNTVLETYSGNSLGSTLNRIILEHVKTPYVLIARDVEYFTNDSRLERLVREIESLQVSVAAGAYRSPDGHWRNGCMQTVYRNYTLRYIEGYDESKHECMFCDYAAGPFVASTRVFKNHGFSDIPQDRGLFEDWFLQFFVKNEEAVVCPDSMFHVSNVEEHKYIWNAFMTIWDLFELNTPSYQTFRLNCQSGFHSVFARTLGLHPCSLHRNAEAVKIIMNKCKNGNMTCELQEGTSLGAVKLGKVLPWERDGDLTFLTANFTNFQALSSEFAKDGYSLTTSADPWCCVDGRQAGGIFKLIKSPWTIELYGQHLMDSEMLVEQGLRPTQVLLDGDWVNVPRNPGLFMRNRYGREIYQHALHWMTTGDSSGWINYKTNSFEKCSSPGHHACFDRYNGDGNIQFTGMMP